jgi:hypothetical protein
MMPTTAAMPATAVPAIMMATITGGDADYYAKQRRQEASRDRRIRVLLGAPLRLIRGLLLQSRDCRTRVRITGIALCLGRAERLHDHRRWLTGTAGQQGDSHDGGDFAVDSHLKFPSNFMF